MNYDNMSEAEIVSEIVKLKTALSAKHRQKVIDTAMEAFIHYKSNIIPHCYLVQYCMSRVQLSNVISVESILREEYDNPQGRLIRTKGRDGGVRPRPKADVAPMTSKEKVCVGCGKKNDHDVHSCWWCGGAV